MQKKNNFSTTDNHILSPSFILFLRYFISFGGEKI